MQTGNENFEKVRKYMLSITVESHSPNFVSHLESRATFRTILLDTKCVLVFSAMFLRKEFRSYTCLAIYGRDASRKAYMCSCTVSIYCFPILFKIKICRQIPVKLPNITLFKILLHVDRRTTWQTWQATRRVFATFCFERSKTLYQ
jgi:hypothetical protein